jgi:pyruvate formate-lyase activating enzyme-like uncharacterized protein
MVDKKIEERFNEKFENFVQTLDSEELDVLNELLNTTSNESKKAYIVEALPGNKTRIIEENI